MNDQRLEQLLRDADSADAPAIAGDDFAAKVLRIGRRRERVRRGVAAVMAATIILLFVIVLPRHRDAAPVVAQASHEDISRELAALDLDARVHEQVIARLMAAKRAAASAESSADVLGAIALERERAAMLLIQQGDWQTPRDARAAKDEYRRARDLFPDTYAANVARDRLSKLDF